ncbi:hypothetical protein MTO96_024192 [Rhipicephalus appendiculatus]
MRPVGRANDLHRDEDNVHQLSEKHEPERAELCESDGRVAQVEAIHAEHAQEHGQQQRRLERVAVGVAARDRPLEGVSARAGAVLADDAVGRGAHHTRLVVGAARLGLLRGRVHLRGRTPVLAHQERTAVCLVQSSAVCDDT